MVMHSHDGHRPQYPQSARTDAAKAWNTDSLGQELDRVAWLGSSDDTRMQSQGTAEEVQTQEKGQRMRQCSPD